MLEGAAERTGERWGGRAPAVGDQRDHQQTNGLHGVTCPPVGRGRPDVLAAGLAETLRAVSLWLRSPALRPRAPGSRAPPPVSRSPPSPAAGRTSRGPTALAVSPQRRCPRGPVGGRDRAEHWRRATAAPAPSRGRSPGAAWFRHLASSPRFPAPRR